MEGGKKRNVKLLTWYISLMSGLILMQKNQDAFSDHINYIFVPQFLYKSHVYKNGTCMCQIEKRIQIKCLDVYEKCVSKFPLFLVKLIAWCVIIKGNMYVKKACVLINTHSPVLLYHP